MRKNQFLLVACFVAVSFFVSSGFFDSNAWGKPEKCDKEDRNTFRTSCLLFQDLYFKTSFGYTNTTTSTETNGNPSLGANIEATETYGVGINYSGKKFLSEIFIKKKNDWRGFRWDILIDPIEFNAGIKFNRQLKVQGQILTRELTDRTSYNVELVYKLPIENIYRLFAN